ncbi:MAG: LamG-like jellyroll fold domain-containing protein, partial [Planctomycetota bacterium]
MNYCLGTRADPEYTKALAPKLAWVIEDAIARLEPAELGVSVVDAEGLTNCRRWIRRPDRIGVDPFGAKTVRAMMHPGYQNADYVGPAGPVDTELSLLSVRRPDGRPIAVLGNFSMHYFGVGGGLSPDFCGLFSQNIEKAVAPDDKNFVGILSQGTSGDLHWMDYARPRRNESLNSYTQKLSTLALDALKHIRYSRSAPIAIAEHRVSIARRTPDGERLKWANDTLEIGARPTNRPQVYAEQARFIDENPREEIVLQSLRVGELGIHAIPCEVYGITGLELKARSPLQPSFTMELANGAAGYIPPAAQHRLGGYTTWPARTAGLEEGAEEKIVGWLLDLAERASGEKRRKPRESHGAYNELVLGDRPLAYWRLDEYRGSRAEDSSGNDRHAGISGLVAYHLPGPESVAFGDRDNRALQLVDATLAFDDASGVRRIELGFWNGLESRVRASVGTLLRFASNDLRLVRDAKGHSVLQFGESAGSTSVQAKCWNHLVVTVAEGLARVYLNGNEEIAAKTNSPPSTLLLGSGGTEFCGRLDEVSLYDRVLTPYEVARRFR